LPTHAAGVLQCQVRTAGLLAPCDPPLPDHLRTSAPILAVAAAPGIIDRLGEVPKWS
jgi:hypothetical protein